MPDPSHPSSDANPFTRVDRFKFDRVCNCAEPNCARRDDYHVDSTFPIVGTDQVIGVIPTAAAATTGVSRVFLIGERYSMIVRFGSLFDPLVVQASLLENLRDAAAKGDPETGLPKPRRRAKRAP